MVVKQDGCCPQLSSLPSYPDQGKATWYPLMRAAKHVSQTATSPFPFHIPKLNLFSLNTRSPLAPLSKQNMLL